MGKFEKAALQFYQKLMGGLPPMPSALTRTLSMYIKAEAKCVESRIKSSLSIHCTFAGLFLISKSMGSATWYNKIDENKTQHETRGRNEDNSLTSAFKGCSNMNFVTDLYLHTIF